MAIFTHQTVGRIVRIRPIVAQGGEQDSYEKFAIFLKYFSYLLKEFLLVSYQRSQHFWKGGGLSTASWEPFLQRECESVRMSEDAAAESGDESDLDPDHSPDLAQQFTFASWSGTKFIFKKVHKWAVKDWEKGLS